MYICMDVSRHHGQTLQQKRVKFGMCSIRIRMTALDYRLIVHILKQVIFENMIIIYSCFHRFSDTGYNIYIYIYIYLAHNVSTDN